MRAYLITTGTVFGLLVVAHIVRIIVEGLWVVRDPWFVLFTIVAAALSIWAFRLLRLPARS